MISIHNSIWVIETELTFKTVSIIYKKFAKDLNILSGKWCIDFSKVNKLDSSGLSLVIEYIKHSKRNNIELKLKNIDSKTLSLAKIHGIKEILEQYTN